jgi:hypothetical protein
MMTVFPAYTVALGVLVLKVMYNTHIDGFKR